jgi:hypothetical protein
MTQLTLDQWTPPPAGTQPREQVSREVAIKRLEMHNDHGPIEKALEDLRETLSRLPAAAEVTSDSLFEDLSLYGFTDNRAIGPVMRRAVKAGLITPTAAFRNSNRPGSHCAPRRIYLNTHAKAHGEGGRP